MIAEKEKCLARAINTILSVIPTLTKFEWERISTIVDYHYTSKAAKVQLDGNDVKNMKRNFDAEILGKPVTPSQSE